MEQSNETRKMQNIAHFRRFQGNLLLLFDPPLTFESVAPHFGELVVCFPFNHTVTQTMTTDHSYCSLSNGPTFDHEYTQNYRRSFIQQRTRVPTDQIPGYRCGFHKWLMCSVTLIPYPITGLTHNHRQEFLLSTGCWLVRQVGTRDKLRRCRHLHLNCIV